MVKKSIENCFFDDIASLQFDVTVVFIVTGRSRCHRLIYFNITGKLPTWAIGKKWAGICPPIHNVRSVPVFQPGISGYNGRIIIELCLSVSYIHVPIVYTEIDYASCDLCVVRYIYVTYAS